LGSISSNDSNTCAIVQDPADREVAHVDVLHETREMAQTAAEPS
jgi:hypothetical protein